jgi:hypothetical protein
LAVAAPIPIIGSIRRTVVPIPVIGTVRSAVISIPVVGAVFIEISVAFKGFFLRTFLGTIIFIAGEVNFGPLFQREPAARFGNTRAFLFFFHEKVT